MGSGLSGGQGYSSCSSMAKIEWGNDSAAALMTSARFGIPEGGSTMMSILTALENGMSSARARAARAGSTCLRWEIAGPVGVLGDQLDRIPAVVRDGGLVEAEVHKLWIGGFEEALDVALVADMAVGVGVELE